MGVHTKSVSGDELLSMRVSRRRAVLLRELLQAPELAAAIGSAAGVRCSRSLIAASRCHGDSMRRMLPSIKAQMPLTLYVCGGSTGSEELAVAERLRLPALDSLFAADGSCCPPAELEREASSEADALGDPLGASAASASIGTFSSAISH